MYVCVCVCIYIYIYIYVHMCVCVHVHTCVHVPCMHVHRHKSTVLMSGTCSYTIRMSRCTRTGIHARDTWQSYACACSQAYLLEVYTQKGAPDSWPCVCIQGTGRCRRVCIGGANKRRAPQSLRCVCTCVCVCVCMYACLCACMFECCVYIM
jgi:hypothetical protein